MVSIYNTIDILYNPKPTNLPTEDNNSTQSALGICNYIKKRITDMCRRMLSDVIFYVETTVINSVRVIIITEIIVSGLFSSLLIFCL